MNARPPKLSDLPVFDTAMTSVFLAHATTAFFGLDRNGRCHYLNPAAESLTGYTLAELLGKKLALFPHPADADLSGPSLEDALASDAMPIVRREGVLLYRDGHSVNVEWSAMHVENGILLEARDCSEEMIRREQARQRDERYRFILDGSSEGLYDWNILTNEVFWSERYYRIVGQDPAIGRPPSYQEFLEMVHPEDRSQVRSDLERQMSLREPYVMSYRIRHADGHYIDLECQGRTYFDEQGRPVRKSGLVRDISEALQAERSLKESEQRFRAMADSAPILIAMSGPDKELTYFNRSWLEFTGKTLEEQLRFGWIEEIHPDDRTQATQAYIEAFAKEEGFEVEYRLKRHDGEYRWIYSQVAPRRTTQGEFAGYIGICIDITERKAAEAELRKSLDRESLVRQHIELISQTFDINQILQTVADAIGQHLKADRCSVMRYSMQDKELNLDLSAQYCRTADILPISQEDIQWILKSLQTMTPETMQRGQAQVAAFQDVRTYLDYVRQSVEALRLPLDVNVFESLTRKYGLRSILRVNIEYRGIPYGSLSLHQCTHHREWTEDEIELLKVLAHHLGSALHQADLYQKEQQSRILLESYVEKLEQRNQELQEFAAIASHDLQAPLRKIMLFGDKLQAQGQDVLDEESLDLICRMQRTSKKMHSLVHDLLTLSRVIRQERPFEKVNLQHIAWEAINDLETHIQEKAAQVQLGEMVTLEADPAQMHQLLLNLIGNALKFCRPDTPPRVMISAARTEQHYCELVISDMGIGIKPEHQERIFKAFQRLHTDRDYPGTGIGLAIVQKIVERHGGSITVKSAPNEGTTFIVRLPLSH